jgi:hypothetical protein
MGNSQHAITDVYDEERRTFLVRYPVWLVVGLGLSGVIVFLLTGFLGFRDSMEPAITGKLFHEPWALYLWFCALILTLQISILRHPSLRRQLTETLIVTVFCIIFVGILYYFNVQISNFLSSILSAILGKHIILKLLGSSPLTYTIINFLIIAIFWVDTIRRWVRRSRGDSPTRRIDLATGEVTFKAESDEIPTMQELVSGDLVAGAFLVLVLALIFRQETLNFFSSVLNVGVPINTCTVSLPGACNQYATTGNPPTLTFIDLIQTLIYLPLGLIILALAATLSGLGAVGGVNEKAVAPSSQALLANREGSSTVNVGEQVSITVLNTLRSALNRRIRIAIGSLAGALRIVAWPSLILLGTIAVAASARYIQQYLHLQSDGRTCTTTACPEYGAVQRLFSEHVQFTAPVSALAWGIVAALAIVFSATLLIYRWRVADNTLRLLGLVSFTVLLVFWIFSLALSAFNAFFSLTNISPRVPFPQPGAATIISFVALLIFGGFALIRTLGRRGQGQPAVPAGVPAQNMQRSQQTQDTPRDTGNA